MHKSNPTFLINILPNWTRLECPKSQKNNNKKNKHKRRKIDKEKEKVSLPEKNSDLSNSLWMVLTAPRWGSEMRETRKELQDGGVTEPADSLGGKNKSGLVYLRDS